MVRALLRRMAEKRTGDGIMMFLSLLLAVTCGAANAFAAAGDLKWQSAYIAGNNFDSPAAISADGKTIYVGKQDGFLYAFSTSTTGTYKWRLSLSIDGIISSPAIGLDGTIYVTTKDGYVFAVTDSGAVANPKWQYPGSADTSLGAFNGSPAIGADGTIYAGSHDQNFYAIAPPATGGTVGTLKWSYKAHSEVNSSPAVGADGTIYVVDSGGFLYAFQDNSINTLKWQYPATGPGGLQDSSPAIGPDGTIYVGGTVTDPNTFMHTGYLYALNPAGSEKWLFPMDGDIDYPSPVIAPDGTIYIGTETYGTQPGYLYAVTDNGANGTLKWRYGIPAADPNAPYGIDDTPAIDSNGVINFGASDGFLYALTDSGTNGTLKWRSPVTSINPDGTYAAGPIYSSPLIGPDGTLYIGAAGGDVFYAISGDSSGAATSAWPMFHHNSLRTGQSLADLIITSVTDPPVQVWAGKTFSATATVKNQGLIGPANAFSTTRYYLSHDPLSKSGATLLAGSSSVPLIPTGGTDTTGATPLTVPSGASPGTYYLLACADDTALIRETDKTNNCKAASGTTTIPVVAAGDINGDGRIDILDALLTLQYAVNLIPHTPDNNVKYLAVADVAPLEPATGMPKGDGKIDVFDALILLQRALDLTTW